MAYPDLQIRGLGEGGRGDSHPEPEIRRGHGHKKNFFRPFGSQSDLKMGGGGTGAPVPSPGSATGQNAYGQFGLSLRERKLTNFP